MKTHKKRLNSGQGKLNCTVPKKRATNSYVSILPLEVEAYLIYYS